MRLASAKDTSIGGRNMAKAASVSFCCANRNDWSVRTARAARSAAKAGVAIELIRNGSRGMFELETLVEVETDTGITGIGMFPA